MRDSLSRRDAYRAVFSPAVSGPMAEVVMRDARYCHADRASLIVSPVTRRADPLAMAFAEGQRDVFNRICADQHHTCADLPHRLPEGARRTMGDTT